VELYITIAFDIEIMWRAVAYLPDWRSFFTNRRNLADLFLATTTSIIQIPFISSSAIYPWLTIFQLARFYRVILFIPRMKGLMVGTSDQSTVAIIGYAVDWCIFVRQMQVFGNLSGLFNMTLFLLLTNLIAGLFAMQLFRGDITRNSFNSPEMTFYQTNAFLAMYQVNHVVCLPHTTELRAIS
jgi:hypothetical protein